VNPSPTRQSDKLSRGWDGCPFVRTDPFALFYDHSATDDYAEEFVNENSVISQLIHLYNPQIVDFDDDL